MTELEVGANFWQRSFPLDSFSQALWIEEGREPIQWSMAFASGLNRGTKALGASMPTCQKCNAFSPSVEQLIAAAPAGEIACTNCGKAIRVREAGSLVKKMLPEAKFVVHEGPSGKSSELLETTKPVAFQCMQCAASIKVDGSSRMIDCIYCNASNYLPDGLWLCLHPVPTVANFFIVGEFNTTTFNSLKYICNPCQGASRSDLPRACYEEFAAHDGASVREAVAGNVKVPPDLLETLANDESRDVRYALAVNPAAPPQALTLLAHNSSLYLRGLLAQNPQIPVEAALLIVGSSVDIAKQLLQSEAGQDPSVIAAVNKEIRNDKIFTYVFFSLFPILGLLVVSMCAPTQN